MSLSPVVWQIPEVASLLMHADYADEKITLSSVSMREFIARMLSYQPTWMSCLYDVRGVFVRLLGMRQEGIPRSSGRTLRAATLPMEPGARASLFIVSAAADERYWIGEASDSHLTAAIAVVVEHLGQTQKRFHVLTIVRYHNWKGPLYFNVIRPFHHLVIESMVRAGAGV